MATRSRIAVELPDGTVRSVYCHWDGYPGGRGVGQTLLQHYQAWYKVMYLLDLGNLSSLGAELGEKHDFDTHFDKTGPGVSWCCAYGRDRGEDDVEAKTHPNIQSLLATVGRVGMDEEYLYWLKQDGEWYYTEPPWAEFKLLKEYQDV